MDYALAKELKEARFLQQGNGYHQCGFHKDHRDFKCDCERGMYKYIPTLSELIEACGKRVVMTVDTNGMTAVRVDGDIENCHGKTPEEAVAKLYIALKKHD